jgi:hypothetical protein
MIKSYLKWLEINNNNKLLLLTGWAHDWVVGTQPNGHPITL